MSQEKTNDLYCPGNRGDIYNYIHRAGCIVPPWAGSPKREWLPAPTNKQNHFHGGALFANEAEDLRKSKNREPSKGSI